MTLLVHLTLTLTWGQISYWPQDVKRDIFRRGSTWGTYWCKNNCSIFIRWQVMRDEKFQRSNFDLDLRMSKGTYLDAAWSEEHDGARIIVLLLIDNKLCTIKEFLVFLVKKCCKKLKFGGLYSLNHWPEVKSDDLFQVGSLICYSVLFTVLSYLL
jgi:hypothetical protein